MLPVIERYWEIFLVLFRTPFQHVDLIWGVVPLYFGWVINELTSDKASFNTAIQTGFAFLWAGAQWAYPYVFKHAAIRHNWWLAINIMVTILVLVVGLIAFVSGIQRRFPKYCSFLGHSRFGNYFMIAIFPIQADKLDWTWSRLIAIVAFAIPIWIAVHLVFKPLRRS